MKMFCLTVVRGNSFSNYAEIWILEQVPTIAHLAPPVMLGRELI